MGKRRWVKTGKQNKTHKKNKNHNFNFTTGRASAAAANPGKFTRACRFGSSNHTHATQRTLPHWTHNICLGKVWPSHAKEIWDRGAQGRLREWEQKNFKCQNAAQKVIITHMHNYIHTYIYIHTFASNREWSVQDKGRGEEYACVILAPTYSYA